MTAGNTGETTYYVSGGAMEAILYTTSEGDSFTQFRHTLSANGAP